VQKSFKRCTFPAAFTRRLPESLDLRASVTIQERDCNIWVDFSTGSGLTLSGKVHSQLSRNFFVAGVALQPYFRPVDFSREE